LLKQVVRMQAGQAKTRSQVLLCIGRQHEAQILDWSAQPGCRQDIVQAATRSDVVVHISGSHQGQAAVV
jgi:hypothetical protein